MDDDMVRCSDGQYRSVHSHPVITTRPTAFPTPQFDDGRKKAKRAPWWRYVWAVLGPILDLIFSFGTLMFLVIVGVIGVLVLLGIGAWEEAKSPVFTLHKNEWVCSMEHTETSTTLISSGKTLIPLVTSSSVCDRYDRRLH